MKIELSNQEMATVLAALRTYQRAGYPQNPDEMPHCIYDIASDGGDYRPMHEFEIDELCTRLNLTPEFSGAVKA
jgi:hypothetical protein